MPTPRFVSHGLTDIGLVRERNEDAFLDRPELGVWAVADGMGGHAAGDFASARVVAALGAPRRPAEDLEDLVDSTKTRLLLVDRELRARAAALGRGAVIASTVVTLLAYGDEFAAIWAGDSRLYLLRDGALQQFSTDHTRVQEAHVLTQAIGAGRLTFGTRVGILRPGDRFLLCSDGLTNMVSDAEIAGELSAAPEPWAAAARLRDLVLARGAADNVTIVIVVVEAAA